MAKKDKNIMKGIASTEGASLGRPTDLSGTALGTYQMIEETRKRMYKRLGYTDIEGAEREFKRNAAFEKRVADEYKDELGEQIPKNIKGKQRDYMIAKGWYTGNVNFPDGVIPHPEAGNKITAGEYARKSTGAGIPYSNSVPKTKVWETERWVPEVYTPEPDPKSLRPTMTALETTPQYKPNITGKPIGAAQTTAMMTYNEPPEKQKIDWKGTASAVTPYLSNLFNAFQKPAPVPKPVYNSPVTLQKVNFDNDRYEVAKDYRTDRLNADQTLDANTAVAVKQFSKGQKFGSMSKINQQERNENTAISNKQVALNAGIAQGNNEILRNYRNLGAERENAITSDRMANVANAADKFIMGQNVQNQYKLDERRMDVLEATDQYGTNAHLLKKLEELDEKRSSKNNGQWKMGGKLPKYSAGSIMKKLKPVY